MNFKIDQMDQIVSDLEFYYEESHVEMIALSALFNNINKYPSTALREQRP